MRSAILVRRVLMARIRTIKPSFFTSLTIAELSLTARLTFIGLWTHADDEGRCVYDARLIKAAIWPLDDRPLEDVRNDIGSLQEASLVTVYRAGERSYVAINAWLEHQKISHPSKSTLPAPHTCEPYDVTSALEPSRKAPGVFPENSLSVTGGKGKERKGREGSDAVATDASRDDVQKICDHLVDLVVANGSARPTITKDWYTHARLMLDKDGRSFDQVMAVMDWAQASTFWRSNILSVPKLREQFDKLRLQMDADSVTPSNGGRRYFGKPGERKSYY